MSYDGYGRMQTRTTPEQGTTSYLYYADDTTYATTDARGAVTAFTYNGRHQVTAINHGVPGGVGATPDFAFAYDAAGNRTSMTDTGPRHGDLAFLLDGAVAVGSKLDDCHDRIAGHFSVGEEGFASVQCPALWVV